ncbi:hypothetical protein [Mesorhizobium sp. M2A.F.Ca.ET.029.05.1.1]|uniref:hypothetical protein n=1 Tax=Mesorhizobium sp. M2A.F.Ca.ET.029.05.1.1 TaxID=2496658 RepID=UPI001FE04B02|nr:hypothetical protein [Mesorhizobium sp. M2A.F.Ca.ET.029.05.1.1]
MIISRDVASGQHCSHYAFWPLPAPIDGKAIAGNSDILAGFDPNFQVFQPFGLSQEQKTGAGSEASTSGLRSGAEAAAVVLRRTANLPLEGIVKAAERAVAAFESHFDNCHIAVGQKLQCMVEPPAAQILRDGLSQDLLKGRGCVRRMESADKRYVRNVDRPGEFVVDEGRHLLHPRNHPPVGDMHRLAPMFSFEGAQAYLGDARVGRQPAKAKANLVA